MTCLETFATLRIFSDSMHPDEIERILAIPGTKKIPRDPSSPYRPRRETNLWEWCTREIMDSTDNSAHLAALIDRLVPRGHALGELRARGCQTDICNYWVSSGQGGPWLDIGTMRTLVDLGLPIWWDVYFADEQEYAGDA